MFLVNPLDGQQISFHKNQRVHVQKKKKKVTPHIEGSHTKKKKVTPHAQPSFYLDLMN